MVCLKFYYLEGCTPLMSNMSVRLTKERFSVNISSPTTYHSNQSVHCLWKITVPKGYRIKVHFSTFDLQNNTNCSNSAVELIEINGSVSTLKGRYCGSYQPDDVISTSSHLSVMYTAANRSTLQHPGFQASISLASAGWKCYFQTWEGSFVPDLSFKHGRVICPNECRMPFYRTLRVRCSLCLAA